MKWKSAVLKGVATVAVAGALMGFAAGVADAATNWGPRCQSLHYAFTTYYSLALSAFEQGDTQAGRYYDSLGDRNYNTYVRAGCNG